MIRRVHLLLLGLALAGACDRKPAPDITTPAPVERSSGSAPSNQAHAAPEYSGAPVGVAEATVLHRSETLQVERQPWKVGDLEGVAWRARLPLDADIELPARDAVTVFRDLLPDDEGPWVAINGGFYEAIPGEDGYRPMGLVVTDGEEVSQLTARGGSGVFFVDENGPAVVHRKAFDAAPTVALQSIDRIVSGGESVVSRRPDARQAARSGVVVGHSHLWFIIAVANADVTETSRGAQLRKTRTGMPLWAFAEYVLATTDVEDALNLDGGVSTQLAVRDGEFELYVDGVRGTINALVARPKSPTK